MLFEQVFQFQEYLSPKKMVVFLLMGVSLIECRFRS